MFLVLWEFEVKPDREKRLQQVYRPDGDWDSLFRVAPNHAGTRLSAPQLEATFISLQTIGSPANPTRNSLLFGEANTKR